MGAWLVLLAMAMGQEAAPPVMPQAASAPAAEKADVCAVATAPETYLGRYLELSGEVKGASTDGLSLTSKECHVGIALGFSDEVRSHEDVKTLFAAVLRGDAGKGLSGDFEGTLVKNDRGEIVRMQVDRIDALRFPKGNGSKL